MTTPNTLPANGGVSDARLWELLHQWRDAVNAERIDTLENEINRFFLLAQSRQPSTQGGEVRAAALEEAAKICEGRPGFKYGGDEFNACARAIRERIDAGKIVA